MLTFVMWATGPTWDLFGIFMLTNIYMLILITVYMIGKRCEMNFVYLLPICLFASYMCIIGKLMIFSNKDSSPDCWTGTKVLHFMIESLMMDGNYLIFVLFFSPSLVMPLFFYSGIYLIGKYVYFQDYFNLTNSQMLVTLICYILTIIGSSIFLYYMV